MHTQIKLPSEITEMKRNCAFTECTSVVAVFSLLFIWAPPCPAMDDWPYSTGPMDYAVGRQRNRSAQIRILSKGPASCASSAVLSHQ